MDYHRSSSSSPVRPSVIVAFSTSSPSHPVSRWMVSYPMVVLHHRDRSRIIDRIFLLYSKLTMHKLSTTPVLLTGAVKLTAGITLCRRGACESLPGLQIEVLKAGAGVCNTLSKHTVFILPGFTTTGKVSNGGRTIAIPSSYHRSYHLGLSRSMTLCRYRLLIHIDSMGWYS